MVGVLGGAQVRSLHFGPVNSGAGSRKSMASWGELGSSYRWMSLKTHALSWTSLAMPEGAPVNLLRTRLFSH